MPSILDAALASPDLEILVSAVTYLDTELDAGLAAALDDPDADLTVFAPTDAAFAQLAVDSGFEGDTSDEAAVTGFLVATYDATTLASVVTYHVSAGAKTLEDVVAAGAIDTLNGADIIVNAPTLVDKEPDLLDPSVATADVIADNGVVHIIDRVLLPLDLPGNDAPTLAGLLTEASGDGFDDDGENFDTLLAALDATGLTDALDDPAADLTAFAPDDNAFAATAAALGFEGGTEAETFGFLAKALTLLGGGDLGGILTNVLLHHVTPESLQSSQVLASDEIETLLSSSTPGVPPLGVNGAALVDADPDLPDANIIAVDFQASNGVGHVIDGVLLPVDILASDGSNDVDFLLLGDDDDTVGLRLDNDYVDGAGGNDLLRLGRGDDVALGGRGADTIHAGRNADLVLGQGGNDTLDGFGGRDTLIGGTGNDMLMGGRGADMFVFAAGDGTDMVMDYQDTRDMIDVSGHGITDFDDLMISQPGANTRIDFDSGDRVILVGVDSADLDAGDFLFASA